MTRKLTALLCTSLLVLAACGGSSGSSSARSEYLKAIHNLEGSPETITLSVDSNPESLQAIAAKTNANLSSDTAQKILDSSFSISSNGASDPKDAQAQITLNVAGSDDLEIRYLNQVFYIQADVSSLLSTFGGDPSQAEALAQQASAAGYSFVGSLIHGKWIELTGLAELTQSLGGGSPSSTEQVKQLQGKLLDILKTTTSVSDEGSDSIGDHLVVSLNLRDFVSKFFDFLKSINPAASQAAPDLSQVPDKTVKLDAWVKDGNLVQQEFDLMQINDLVSSDSDKLPERVTKLALKVAFEPFSGSIEAPSGVVEVNLQQLLQTVMGGLTGSSSSSTSSSSSSGMTDFCKQLEKQPASVQKQFKDQCPNL